jgi:hypothetical protein
MEIQHTNMTALFRGEVNPLKGNHFPWIHHILQPQNTV